MDQRHIRRGKTTTAKRDGTDWRMFDPEHVGFLLAGDLRDLEFDDFQDLSLADPGSGGG